MGGVLGLEHVQLADVVNHQLRCWPRGGWKEIEAEARTLVKDDFTEGEISDGLPLDMRE